MTVTARDQVGPDVALQPLTSAGRVHSTPPPDEKTTGEGQPLTTPKYDGPVVHGDEDVTKLKQRPRKRKYLETAVLYTGYFTWGLSFGIQGPSILDLKLAVHTDTRTITRLFIGRSVGHLLGAFLCGVILEKFNRNVQYGVTSFLMTTLLAVLPWTWHVAIMGITMAFCSVASGFCDAASNMCLLIIWDRDNGPWMQALHLFFAVGALIGPLVAKPFLKEVPSAEHISLDNDDTSAIRPVNISETATVGNTIGGCAENCTHFAIPQYPDLGTDVWVPYLLLGVMGVIIFSSSMALYYTRSSHLSDEVQKQDEVKGRYNPRSKVLKGLLIFSVFLFYTCHCATEIGFQSYIFAYVVDHHGWLKNDAAILTSVTFTTYMFGRFLGILIVRYSSPSFMLVFDCVGLVVANIPLAFFSHAHVAVIWVSTAFNGWFVSRLYATGITWMDRYIRVSGVVTTVFMVAGSMGDMLGPVILTALYGNYGLGAFAPLMLASSTCVLFVCLFMLFVAYRLGPHELTTSENTENEMQNNPEKL